MPRKKIPKRLSQIELVAGIFRAMTRLGFRHANQRQINAVIQAADLICAEVNRPHMYALPGMGLRAWLGCDQRCEASHALLQHAWQEGSRSGESWADPALRAQVCGQREVPHPTTAASLWNCVQLMQAVPQVRPHLASIAGRSAGWAALVGSWEVLEGLVTTVPGDYMAGKLTALRRKMLELLQPTGVSGPPPG